MKTIVADYRYRVMCLRIAPTLGAVIRLTHHPRDLTMSNGQVYKSFNGNDFSGYTAGSGMSPSMIDLEGIAGLVGINRDALGSGVYDNARCYLFATTWKTPIDDEEPIVASILGKVTMMDDRYRVEEMALIDALNQSVGDTYTAQCPKTFGGQEYAGCKISLGPITKTGTITSVISRSVFRDSARTEAADYFGVGTIQFTSGANTGLKPIGIKRYDADGTIETYEPAYYSVAIGDTYSMIPGCRKRRAEDCVAKWNNVTNHGGFADIPTSSQYGEIGTK